MCDLWVMNAGGRSKGRMPQPSDGTPRVTTVAEAISRQNGGFNCPFCPQAMSPADCVELCTSVQQLYRTGVFSYSASEMYSISAELWLCTER